MFFLFLSSVRLLVFDVTHTEARDTAILRSSITSTSRVRGLDGPLLSLLVSCAVVARPVGMNINVKITIVSYRFFFTWRPQL